MLADEGVDLLVARHIGARLDLAAAIGVEGRLPKISRVSRMQARNSVQSSGWDM